MNGAESRAARLPRRRPLSLQSFIDSTHVIIMCHLYADLVNAGLPREQADRLAREALRKAKKDIYEDLPDVTKADLRSIRVRRSP